MPKVYIIAKLFSYLHAAATALCQLLWRNTFMLYLIIFPFSSIIFAFKFFLETLPKFLTMELECLLIENSTCT